MTYERARANNLALVSRTILTGFPASAAALGVPAGASAKVTKKKTSVEVSPIMALFREWDRMRIAADRFEEGNSLRFAREELHALENQLMAMPAKTAAELAAKIMAHTEWGNFQLPGMSHPLWAELRSLVGEG